MKKVILAGLFVLSACSLHNQNMVIRPESLINASAEKISFPLSDVQSVEAVAEWIRTGDVPSGAEISCRDNNKSCAKAKNVLNRYKVAFIETPVGSDAEQGVALLYDRLTASACFLNELGCSTSLNSVRMVANREQFVKPYISDLQDAETSVRAVGRVR